MQNTYDKNIDQPILNYSVIGSSSEDEEHPLYSLISQEKNDGWCSSPFCKYPQEILIQLNNPSKLSQINITLHEHKIPSKIDFYYFYPNQKKKEEEKLDYNNIPFIKMGYIIPNSNEKSNFKLREFKKIKINENALYIKLTLHKNFINLENKYNQVSIISIKFFGYELENNNPLEYKNILISEINKNKINDYNEDNLDEICITKLKEIKATLDLCIKKEKYDSAKIFRELYQRVKLLGEKMKNLSECKLRCIETNDFAACKKIQNDINRIKNLIGDINANFIDDENEKNDYKEKVDENKVSSK
jgi:hypothetical protein